VAEVFCSVAKLSVYLLCLDAVIVVGSVKLLQLMGLLENMFKTASATVSQVADWSLLAHRDLIELTAMKGS